jgi:hypothetical protein
MAGDRGASAKPLGDNPSRTDLVRACHEIVDAASSLLLNLNHLERSDVDRAGAFADARSSVDRIATLARAVRQAIEYRTWRDVGPT